MTLLTASNVNSVVVIHVFYTLFAFTFHVDGMPLVPRMFIAVAEVIVGAGLGISAGFLLRYWRTEPKVRRRLWVRGLRTSRKRLVNATLILANLSQALVVAGAGYFALLLGSTLRLAGGGAMACLFLAVGFAHKNDAFPVATAIKTAWVRILEAALFGLLGAEIDLANFTWTAVWTATVVILVGLVARFAATYASSRWSGWSYGTSTFVAFCWLPKATVQAALSTVALEFVRSNQWYTNEQDSHEEFTDEEMEAYRLLWVDRGESNPLNRTY